MTTTTTTTTTTDTNYLGIHDSLLLHLLFIYLFIIKLILIITSNFWNCYVVVGKYIPYEAGSQTWWRDLVTSIGVFRIHMVK